MMLCFWKRLITVFLILALLLPAAALSDLPDISGLSQAELIELNRQIQLKLFSEKLIEGVTVPSGVYTVGVDIPEGTYRIVYHMPYDTAFCSFYLQETGGGTYSTLLGFGSSTEIGKIFLQRNAYISIDGGDLVFFAYSGLFN